MSTPLRPLHVEPRSLRSLLDAVPALRPARAVTGDEPAVTGMTQDSRAVCRGDLYLARSGATGHGARYAADVVAAGAVALLTDHAGLAIAGDVGVPVLLADDPRRLAGPVAAAVYGHPADDLLLLGVTGTNGKTTTGYLLHAGLAAGGRPAGLIGTVETRIGGDAVPSLHTTPEATDLQALLAVMRERGVGGVAMEVSSHALALHRVDGTRYAVATFTNLSRDHLDFHAGLEDYFRAKARLFTPELADRAVINVDDEHGARLAATVAIPLVTFSATGAAHADWRAVDCAPDATGTSLRLLGPAGVDVAVRAPLPGAFNVANTVAAVATLVEAGVDAGVAAEAVGRAGGIPGRLQPVDGGQPFPAYVDFAHTPDAVQTLLATLRPVTSGRLIIVLGCGGDRDPGKRPMMGAAAVAGADIAVLTSDNPRSENPDAILAAMVDGAGGVPAGRRGEMVVEPDRRAAVARAVALASPGDVLVVAGKGHEQGQEVAGVTHPFDDRVVLAEQLRARWSSGVPRTERAGSR